MDFREMCCLHLQGKVWTEAASSSKMLVPMYQTTLCHIQEDSNLHSLKNLKSLKSGAISKHSTSTTLSYQVTDYCSASCAMLLTRRFVQEVRQ
jgi:hypothetical protein